MTFFILPGEIRNIIYKFTLEDDLKLPLYTTQIEKAGHTGTVPYQHFRTQLVNLTRLAKICRQIKAEAMDPFYHCTQLYVWHQPHTGFWPPMGPYTDYERTMDLIKSEPTPREARHVRWTVILVSDEEVFHPYHHQFINRVRMRFSTGPDTMRPYRGGGIPYWLRDSLGRLETLRLDLDCRRDWLDLCAESGWLYPLYLRVKKFTLSLNFAEKDVYIEKARMSRYVLRGKPKEMMLEKNILNHLLTLPEDEYKDAPNLPIENHFGALDPEWSRLYRT
ncbi:hypothetical protein SMACR_01786 [Sordaria macrospora]|uniref:WGS project CABT00000000 data, contig 2.5 n=2 Tax=Sordaria macrospora TaxID=5147 RepID=F7VRV2_SORMK|nr:uncharacterized protein SMAC_01786 [Sordaria macrospora k-hell]KAA8636481.1 hypothetical protein SMACR_01786 [Sordaria macrospora]CCC08238.1 unnamed protein product [Sordaria macrospora k-hell]